MAEAEAAISAITPELQSHYPGFAPDLVREQMALTRQTGFALNPGQLTAGSWGLGVAVLNHEGRCEGALSIAAIESRIAPPRREQLVSLLKAEAQRLSDRLERPPGATGFAALARRQAAK
jgi:DNA-binding IclR family transcriptional regulator